MTIVFCSGLCLLSTWDGSTGNQWCDITPPPPHNSLWTLCIRFEKAWKHGFQSDRHAFQDASMALKKSGGGLVISCKERNLPGQKQDFRLSHMLLRIKADHKKIAGEESRKGLVWTAGYPDWIFVRAVYCLKDGQLFGKVQLIIFPNEILDSMT